MPITFPSDEAEISSYHRFVDDFLAPASATASSAMAYTSIDDSGTGTNAFQSVAGGVYNVVTAASDNDYHTMRSVATNWTFAASKKLWADFKFSLTEATVLESTWWMGFSNTTTTGGFQANAAGPLASYTGALVYKTPETALTVNAQASAVAVQSTLSAFASTVSAAACRVQLYWDGVSAITPHFYNGTTWYSPGTLPFTAGTTAMYLMFGVKAGPTAAAETLAMDYIKVVQQR